MSTSGVAFSAGFARGMTKISKTRFDEELEEYRGDIKNWSKQVPAKPWENLSLHSLLGAVPGALFGGAVPKSPAGVGKRLVGAGIGAVLGGLTGAGVGELVDRDNKGTILQARKDVKNPKFKANTRRVLLDNILEKRDDLEGEVDDLEDEASDLRNEVDELKKRLAELGN